MASVSKFANANTVVTTGWTNPTNAYADDTSYATAAPAKSTSITTDYGFPAFATGDIPDGVTIDSVTALGRYFSSTTSSTNAVFGLQLNNNGTLLGTESTFGMTLSEADATKAATTGITLADLRNANYVKARCRGFRATSNTAITWSLDYVTLTVAYHFALTGTGAIAATSSVSSTEPTLGLKGTGGIAAGATTGGNASLALLGSGSISATSQCVGDATVQTNGQGSVSSVSSVSGDATIALNGTGDVANVSAASGNATLNFACAGASTADSQVTGSGVVDFQGTGTITATSVVTGDATVEAGERQDLYGTGDIAAESTVTGDALVNCPGTGSVTSVSSITGSCTVQLYGMGSVAAVSGVAGNAVVHRIGVARRRAAIY